MQERGKVIWQGRSYKSNSVIILRSDVGAINAFTDIIAQFQELLFPLMVKCSHYLCWGYLWM